MNTTDQIHAAVEELLTPVEQSLGACADDGSQVSHACDLLREAVESLEDAAGDEWCQCGRTLANLLEIVDCFADGSETLGEGTADQIVEFVNSSLPRLRQSLTGENDAGEGSMIDVIDQARTRWGEYLTLVEGNGFYEASSLDTELDMDGGMDAVDGTATSSPSEQLDLILSAVQELSDGAHSEAAAGDGDVQHGSQQDPHGDTRSPGHRNSQPSDPVGDGDGGATSGATPDAMFKSRRSTGLPAAPAATQAVALSEILREAFLEDAEQCLSSMEQAVIQFENNPRGPAPIDQWCRDLHTLKGASASIGLSELATYLHEVEEWLPSFDQTRDTAGLQPILDCVDFVRKQTDALGQPAAASQAPPAGQAVETPRPLTAAPVVSDRNAEPGDETVRVRSSQLDRMMNLLVDLVIWRRRRDRRVAELSEGEDELSRCVRRLDSLAKGHSFSSAAPVGSSVVGSPSAGMATVDSALVGSLSTGLLSSGRRPADDQSREPSRFLGEITNDLREIASGLRDCHQSMAEENRAVSQFIQQFRQQLAQARRVPLSGLFQRLQRVVREAARLEGKQVRLEFVGQNTGLERSLQERLYEPLLHLVRNAVCHGIETEDKRLRSGKDAVGTITLEASGSSQMLLLDIRDDGGGLDFDAIRRRGIERGLVRPDEPVSPSELSRLIFHPGFSTRTETNEVAGRGVGMDVVLTALNRCRCQIDVHSEAGVGTTFRLAIPLPSVIEHSLVFRCGGQLFGLPMQFVMSTSLGDTSGDASGDTSGDWADASSVSSHVELRRILRLPASEKPAKSEASRSLVLGSNLPASASPSRTSSPNGTSASSAHETSGQRRAFVVEDILGPEEVVVRPLPPLLRRHPVLSGVTLSGAGEVVLLLDSPRLLREADESSAPELATDSQTLRMNRLKSSEAARPKILIAEDSLSARRRLVEKLLPYGFDITEASDGLEALNFTRTTTFDAVFSDLEMPGLNGFELLTAIKNDPRTPDKPVVIVTSRDEPETKAKAQELGADGFLSKPVSDATIAAMLDQLAMTPTT